jgi:hypothetical protein
MINLKPTWHLTILSAKTKAHAPLIIITHSVAIQYPAYQRIFPASIRAWGNARMSRDCASLNDQSDVWVAHIWIEHEGECVQTLTHSHVEAGAGVINVRLIQYVFFIHNAAHILCDFAHTLVQFDLHSFVWVFSLPAFNVIQHVFDASKVRLRRIRGLFNRRLQITFNRLHVYFLLCLRWGESAKRSPPTPPQRRLCRQRSLRGKSRDLARAPTMNANLSGYGNPVRALQNQAMRNFYSVTYSWPYQLDQHISFTPKYDIYNPVSKYSEWGSEGRAFSAKWNPEKW